MLDSIYVPWHVDLISDALSFGPRQPRAALALKLVFRSVGAYLLHKFLVEAEYQERWCPLPHKESILVAAHNFEGK